MQPFHYLTDTIQAKIAASFTVDPTGFERPYDTQCLDAALLRVEAGDSTGEDWRAIAAAWRTVETKVKPLIRSHISVHLSSFCHLSSYATNTVVDHWLDSLAWLSEQLRLNPGAAFIPVVPEVLQNPGAPKLSFTTETELIGALRSDSPLQRLQACLRLTVDPRLAASYAGEIRRLLDSESVEVIRTLAVKALGGGRLT
jgi:hypothetical protein